MLSVVVCCFRFVVRRVVSGFVVCRSRLFVVAVSNGFLCVVYCVLDVGRCLLVAVCACSMMYGVCNYLYGVCLLCAVHSCVLFAGCLLTIVCCWPCVVSCLCAVCCILYIVCCRVCVEWCALCAVCCVLCFVGRMLSVV